MQVTGQDDLHWNIDARHDRAAIRINKIEAKLVLAFILMTESQAQSDGALGVHGWELRGANCVKCPEEIQFEVLIRRRIAEDCHLNVHARTLEVELKLRESLTIRWHGVRLKVSATAIWSAAASEARRRFGLCLCRIHLKTSLSSQSGVALRLPPHSIKSRSVTDSFNHTRLHVTARLRAGFGYSALIR